MKHQEPKKKQTSPPRPGGKPGQRSVAKSAKGRRVRTPDPEGAVPKDLKQRMKWDLNRLVWEVKNRLARGKAFTEVGKWLDPLKKTNVAGRQAVGKVSHEGDSVASPHYLQVVVDKITWQVDGATNKAVGFLLRGSVFRDRIKGRALDGLPPPKKGKPVSPLYITSSSSKCSPSSSSSSSSSPVGTLGVPRIGPGKA
jgi:hypothetical protein